MNVISNDPIQNTKFRGLRHINKNLKDLTWNIPVIASHFTYVIVTHRVLRFRLQFHLIVTVNVTIIMRTTSLEVIISYFAFTILLFVARRFFFTSNLLHLVITYTFIIVKKGGLRCPDAVLEGKDLLIALMWFGLCFLLTLNS